jgi:hypothetical protein
VFVFVVALRVDALTQRTVMFRSYVQLHGFMDYTCVCVCVFVFVIALGVVVLTQRTAMFRSYVQLHGFMD